MSTVVRFKRTHNDARTPWKSYPGDAGSDLFVCQLTTVIPHSFMDVPTGVHAELPEGYFGRITGRSSSMRKYGLIIIEGIIDNGYRGELFVGVHNPTRYPVVLDCGTRIAQLILHRINEVGWQEVDELSPSERGNRGFGSSGF